MRGAVVHDPEHSRGGAIGLLPHDLGEEAAERTDLPAARRGACIRAYTVILAGVSLARRTRATGTLPGLRGRHEGRAFATNLALKDVGN